ncbi:hypothetical protein ACHAWF_005765 [Thalassiosira exigua]
MPGPTTSTPEAATAAFAKQKAADPSANNDEPRGGGSRTMSFVARVLIFGLIPCLTGLTGLGVSYLQSLKGPDDEGDGEPLSHVVDFDRDFVTPFLLGLALVVVIGFQTGGFSSDGPRRGAFVWPKARRVQRVRTERVVVDDEGKKEK